MVLLKQPCIRLRLALSLCLSTLARCKPFSITSTSWKTDSNAKWVQQYYLKCQLGYRKCLNSATEKKNTTIIIIIRVNGELKYNVMHNTPYSEALGDHWNDSIVEFKGQSDTANKRDWKTTYMYITILNYIHDYHNSCKAVCTLHIVCWRTNKTTYQGLPLLWLQLDTQSNTSFA